LDHTESGSRAVMEDHDLQAAARAARGLTALSARCPKGCP